MVTRSRLYRAEVIILRGKDWGEADRLLTLFTSERGKMRAVVRGARRTKSKLGGHCQVLTHSQMLLAQGRNIDVVTQCHSLHTFLPLRSELGQLSKALYLAELVDSFSPEAMPILPLFHLTLDCLEWLCQAKDEETVLRYFEVNLLGISGYRPQLGSCLGCRLPLSPATNYYTPNGGMLCPRCHLYNRQSYPLSVTGLKVLRFLQQADIDQAQRLKVAPEVNREVAKLLRLTINLWLEGEVKSAAWLDRLSRETPLPQGRA